MKLTPRQNTLEALILQARLDYTAGTPTVTDEVFDAWADELAELNSKSPAVTAIGAPVHSDWPKVRHGIPMGSLDKVNTPEEMNAWIDRWDPHSPGFLELLISEKLDGISCFAGETPVLLANGEQVSIQDIVNSGMTPQVLSWDPKQGFVTRKVLAGHNNGVREDWVRLILEDGTSVLVTSDHLFYVKDEGWVPARDLLGKDVINTCLVSNV